MRHVQSAGLLLKSDDGTSLPIPSAKIKKNKVCTEPYENSETQNSMFRRLVLRSRLLVCGVILKIRQSVSIAMNRSLKALPILKSGKKRYFVEGLSFGLFGAFDVGGDFLEYGRFQRLVIQFLLNGFEQLAQLPMFSFHSIYTNA